MIKMNKINNYNKEEHIQFMETLIKTEQVAVFINNMDISERSKIEQNDTLEYLYNRIIELQNNWNELKKWLESKGTSTKEENDALCYFYTYKKMQELEGNNE